MWGGRHNLLQGGLLLAQLHDNNRGQLGGGGVVEGVRRAYHGRTLGAQGTRGEMHALKWTGCVTYCTQNWGVSLRHAQRRSATG
jgi:hypothetical protein